MSEYDKFMERFKQEGAKMKVLEIDQGVLWLKNSGLQSTALKEIIDKPKIVSEGFLNQMMQLAYNEGCKAIEERSFDKGYEQCWSDVLKKLEINND